MDESEGYETEPLDPYGMKDFESNLERMSVTEPTKSTKSTKPTKPIQFEEDSEEEEDSDEAPETPPLISHPGDDILAAWHADAYRPAIPIATFAQEVQRSAR